MNEQQHMTIRNNTTSKKIVHYVICGSLQNGDRLIVVSPQKAVFLKNDRVTSCYEPGSYTWNSENKWPHEGKLYYVDLSYKEELRWHFCFRNTGSEKKIDLYGSVTYHANDAVCLIKSMALRQILEYTDFESSLRLAKHLLKKRLPYVCEHMNIYSDSWFLEEEQQIADMLHKQLEIFFLACGFVLDDLYIEKILNSQTSEPMESLIEFNDEIDASIRHQSSNVNYETESWNDYAGSWANYSDWANCASSWLNDDWTNLADSWMNDAWANSGIGIGCNDTRPPQIETNEKACPVAEASFKASAGKVERGESFLLNIAMYSEKYRDRAEEILCSSNKTQTGAESGLYNVDVGSRIRIRIFSPDIQISDDVCEQTWNGKLNVFQYLIEVPGNYSKHTLQIRCRVYADDSEITELKLLLTLSGSTPQVAINQEAIRTAFASYSSKDRAIVAARIQGMLAATNDELDIFLM